MNPASRSSQSERRVITLIAIWWIPVTVWSAHRNSILLQVLAFLVTPCFLGAVVISILSSIEEWNRKRWRSLAPLVVCVLSLALCIGVVRIARHEIFLWSLPSYESIVRQMQSGQIRVTENWSRIPAAETQARLAYCVFAMREDENDGALTVEFLTEGGYPVRHAGYLFRSSGVIKPDSMAGRRWPYRREMRAKWFYVAD